MPLPPSGPREELHLRRIEMRGYRRADGLYEVDGRVNDSKPYAFVPSTGGSMRQPGDFIHDMWVRLVVDDQFYVHDVIAVSDSTPHPYCREAAPTLKLMTGVRIAGGWTREVKKRLGGTASCTHLMEILIPMGTVVYQTLSKVRRERDNHDAMEGPPKKIGSCFAYASDSEVVLARWPKHYTGADGTTQARVIPIVDES